MLIALIKMKPVLRFDIHFQLPNCKLYLLLQFNLTLETKLLYILKIVH